jgi:two-component system response regulator AtoC
MKIDVRVVAATAKNLEEEVEKGTFRQDLYYRLNVMTIKLPPLDQRTEDIPLLCKHFINQFNQRLDKDISGLAPEAMSRLLEYSWPGNVRELENGIERAMVIADDSLLLPEHFPAAMMQNNGPKQSDDIFYGFSLKDAQKIMEKKFVTRALEETEGNRTRAAKLLEISHPSLLTKIKAYDIDL